MEENKRKKKPIFKKWWFWLIVIILIVMVKACSDGGDTSKPASNTTKTNTAAKEAEKVYKIGDNIAAGKINVIINKCSEKSEFKSNNQFIDSVKTEGKFIVVDAKLTNNDSEARTIDTNMFKLIDSKNREFNVYDKVELMTLLGDKYLFLESVNPGMSRAGTFVFEVPKDIKSYSLKVYPGIMFESGTPEVVKLK